MGAYAKFVPPIDGYCRAIALGEASLSSGTNVDLCQILANVVASVVLVFPMHARDILVLPGIGSSSLLRTRSRRQSVRGLFTRSIDLRRSQAYRQCFLNLHWPLRSTSHKAMHWDWHLPDSRPPHSSTKLLVEYKRARRFAGTITTVVDDTCSLDPNYA